MRDMETIRADLKTANDAYLKVREDDERESVWRPFSDQTKALKRELSEAISDGAQECPDCGTAPHGMRHVRGTHGGGEVTFYHTFEIGCLSCPKKAVASTPPESSGADLPEHGPAARARAVAKWNAGEYVPPKAES